MASPPSHSGSQAIALAHRDFLVNKARFKTIVQITSEQILDSIHLVYRLNYLKDTAIARFVDDSVLSNINSLIYVHSQDIANHIFHNKDILQELLQKMRSPEMHAKHDAIEFFMEVCQMSKSMQMGQRFSFFESLSQSSSNLIEILAESFYVYYPDEHTLRYEAFEDTDSLLNYLIQLTLQGQKPLKATEDEESQDPGLVRATIEDFLKPHDKYDIRKLDLMKINAIEILMNISQFAPSASLRTFVLCEDQR